MTDDGVGKRSAYDKIADPVTLRRLLEATLLLESNQQLGAVLSHIVEEALALANARYGALGVLDDTGQEVVEFYATGLPPDEEAALLAGPLPTGQGVLGVLIEEPRPIRIKAIADHPLSVGFPPSHPPMASFLGAPIKVRDRVYGNIYLTDKIGADEFTQDDEIVIEALALAAGIAVENARLNQRAGEVAVYEERDRMARDLHDGVIQRLFAIGLSLQGMTSAQAGRAVAESISTVIDDVDDTIRQVRTTIFELGTEGRGRGIRVGVLALVDELRPMIGFKVPVEFVGPVDTAVTDEVAEQLLPALREALSNVARHAQATEVRIRLVISGGTCRLEVRDNGSGMVDGPPTDRRHGLSNLASRAEFLGGTFEVLQPASGGTTLIWQVPAVPGKPTPIG